MIYKIKKCIRFCSRYFLYKIVYPGFYKLLKNKKIKNNKIVFVEIRYKKITDSMRLLYDCLKTDNNKLVKFVSFETLNANRLKKVLLSLKVLFTISNARVVIISDGSAVISSCNLRKETKLIQVWHGCGAFKKFGFSTAKLIFGDSLKDQLRYPAHRNYSLVTVSGEEVIRHFSEAMRIRIDDDIIQAIGISRTDVFFDDKFINNAKKRVYKLIPQSNSKKIILYAPTFRGHVANAQTANELDLQMLYCHLKDDYIILIKHHPLVKNKPVIPDVLRDFSIDVTNKLTIEELICVSDICITDYSSLIFEYSLFEKPMIFYAYDIENYIDWRGFYYNYEEFVPGDIVRNNVELLEKIKNIDKYDKQKIKAFKNKFMSACDGHSTERILNVINNYIDNE